MLFKLNMFFKNLRDVNLNRKEVLTNQKQENQSVSQNIKKYNKKYQYFFYFTRKNYQSFQRIFFFAI